MDIGLITTYTSQAKNAKPNFAVKREPTETEQASQLYGFDLVEKEPKQTDVLDKK